MKISKYILVLILIWNRSILGNDLTIRTENDCMTDNHTIIDNKYAFLIQYSPRETSLHETCSVFMANAWSIEKQNGLGVFLPRRIDCSTMIKIECLSITKYDENQKNRTFVQYTCHTSANNVEMPCNSIKITFERKIQNGQAVSMSEVQVVSLAKEPCSDKQIFFSCPQSYPGSCVNADIRCSGRSECPYGDDEQHCHRIRKTGLSLLTTLFIILCALFMVCVLSTVLLWCCCRAVIRSILQRFGYGKKRAADPDKSLAQGEDDNLMKNLTTTGIVEETPKRNSDPNVVLIDSTKPIYPRLE